jgi:hypothetical protein
MHEAEILDPEIDLVGIVDKEPLQSLSEKL